MSLQKHSDYTKICSPLKTTYSLQHRGQQYEIPWVWSMPHYSLRWCLTTILLVQCDSTTTLLWPCYPCFPLFQMPRDERFPQSFLDTIQSLLTNVTGLILQTYRERPHEMKNANISLAHFIKVKHTYLLSPSLTHLLTHTTKIQKQDVLSQERWFLKDLIHFDIEL